MRVLYIITGLGTGGAETMLLKLLERLDRERYTPFVISLTTVGEIGPKISMLGVGVQALGMLPGKPSPTKFIKLLNLIKEIKPDIVHTWLYHADFFGGVAAYFAGVPLIVWSIRNTNLDRDKTNWITRMVARACAVASNFIPNKILSCSEVACRAHLKLGYSKKKIVVIPNGFDLNLFRPSPEYKSEVHAELGLPERTPLIGLIARFDPLKNHAGFFEAAAAIHEALPDVHFLLAGAGVDSGNQALRLMIEKFDLGLFVHLLGRREDMPRLMASLDVLASPSFGEAFPNVIGEAMACGVPCVVTDVGDSGEIVGQAGWVVKSGDMKGLAKKIIEILKLPKSEKAALASLARTRVESSYELGYVVQRYQSFYEQTAQEGR